MSRPSRSTLTWVLVLALGGCAIAETKLPPEPTVEYLPCTSMEPSSGARVAPGQVLDDDSGNWGGFWTVGDDWHIGLVDVSPIDWQVVCPQIGDPDLVVHEVPHSMTELEGWVTDLEASAGDEETATLDVEAGQYAIEVHAPDLDDAAEFASDIPLDAWSYEGPVSSQG
jgi:hypothetical protein